MYYVNLFYQNDKFFPGLVVKANKVGNSYYFADDDVTWDCTEDGYTWCCFCGTVSETWDDAVKREAEGQFTIARLETEAEAAALGARVSEFLNERTFAEGDNPVVYKVSDVL